MIYEAFLNIRPSKHIYVNISEDGLSNRSKCPGRRITIARCVPLINCRRIEKRPTIVPIGECGISDEDGNASLSIFASEDLRDEVGRGRLHFAALHRRKL